MNWFFAAMDDPRLEPMIFSRGSLDKQAAFGDDFGAWMKWLRETLAEADRKSMEITNLEMKRVPSDDDEGWKDKFEIKVRLKAWSHSIRQNQFGEWNANSASLKLASGSGRHEVIVTMMVPMRVATQNLWQAGWNNTSIFVTALNIGTRGFFWWYTPEHVSRYCEKIRDVEHDCEFVVDRIPMLTIDWPKQALKSVDLNRVGAVYGFIAQSNSQQLELMSRYFRTLGLMAKNDIFFQFEPNIFFDFISVLKDALLVFGDWDGRSETAESAILAGIFGGATASDQFAASVRDMLYIVSHMSANKVAPRPITLDDAATAKFLYESYILAKVQFWYMSDSSRSE